MHSFFNFVEDTNLRLQKLLEHSFEAPIWRLIPSSTNLPSWVVETRTPKQDVAYYYCTVKSSPKQLVTELSWWSGVETVLGRHIVFHGFVQQDLPFHQGIKVVDGESGKLLWQEDFLVYETASETVLWAKVPTGNQTIISLDVLSGREVEVKSSLENKTNEDAPLYFPQENEHFLSILEFVKSLTNQTPIKAVEYLELNEGLILSYFVPNGKLLDNYLLATDLNGKLLLHQQLTTQLKGIAKGTFYVSNGLLSFVQDRNTLIVYRITSNA